MEKEIWKDVVGFEGKYQVSSWGRARSLDHSYQIFIYGKWRLCKRRGKMLSTRLNSSGYKQMCLSRGKSKRFILHRLIAIAFLGQPKNDKNCVNHKDFNKLNNRIENLEWLSRKENVSYSDKAGRYLKHRKLKSIEMKKRFATHNPFAKLKNHEVIKIRKLHKDGFTYVALGKRYKVNETTIADIIKGRTWVNVF